MALSVKPLLPAHRRLVSRVAIRRAPDYRADLAGVILETLREFNLALQNKTILLKPNFVGPDALAIGNTHPAVVAAAREAFLRLGAAKVIVGEGPALERDGEALVEAMNLRDWLGPLSDTFVDLNADEVYPVALRTRASRLRSLFLPATVLRADFVVSVAKMKTHRWAGVTLSLKNMFGIVPGCCYGWPKNVLHWAGITPAILDLNSTAGPDFSIVDGIVGMEGDGPTAGDAKSSCVLVLGEDPVAVDATCVRIMGLVPERIDYLKQAALLLGNIRENEIHQIGEPVPGVASPYRVMDSFRRLREQ